MNSKLIQFKELLREYSKLNAKRFTEYDLPSHTQRELIQSRNEFYEDLNQILKRGMYGQK
ncbi:hypothetical protein [Legionella bozemanae]|uniref:hypothetical protein n=1 Tax=Legionella bozemanae TaxID=447 RepID=UPI00399D46F9